MVSSMARLLETRHSISLMIREDRDDQVGEEFTAINQGQEQKIYIRHTGLHYDSLVRLPQDRDGGVEEA